MKRQRSVVCWLFCFGLSLFAEAQEAPRTGGKIQAIDSRPTTVLAMNSMPRDASGSELAALPTAPEPMLTPQPVIKPTSNPEIKGPTRGEVRLWKGLAVAEHSAAIFDGWSTRESLTSGNGYETDPLMKPFANSAAIYPMLQIGPFGADYLSHRFMRSNHAFLRRMWWVPQVASISSSMWYGARNVQVADLKR